MNSYFGKIKEYGCIAEHLGHSFSGEIHHLLSCELLKSGRQSYRYTLEELTPDELASFLARRDFKGINVTIPYKQAVIPYLDELTPEAQMIGAVNTIVRRDGRLIGHNTDFFGMQYAMAAVGIELSGKKVLILGTGGTAHTAHAVAKSAGASEIYHVSRHAQDGAITYDQLSEHTDAQILINTTPVGMYPNDEQSPLPCGLSLSDFGRLSGVFDAIYHPLRTELISAALELGVPATGGLAMLVAQAAAATERFLDCTISQDIIQDVLGQVEAQKQNIVLIGMPSCGKTTVGRLLSEALQCPLIDTDEVFYNTHGTSAGEYITMHGEAAFREQEALIIRQIAVQSGAVIATGGGAILRDENVRRLKRNGRLYFLDRSLASLEGAKDRPLSADKDALRRRYEERYSRYRAVADVHLPIGDGETSEESARRILTPKEENQ